MDRQGSGERRGGGTRVLHLAAAAALVIAMLLTAACTRLSETELTAIYADKTILFHDDAHGYQIEYTSAEGGAYLWYPGNAGIVVGKWRVGPGDQVCYRYGPSTYNPVTKRWGGEFECVRGRSSRSRMVETLDGDAFGLARRKWVPYELHPTDKGRLPPEFR